MQSCKRTREIKIKNYRNCIFEAKYCISYIRSKPLEWFGHVWRADGQIVKEVLVNKNKQKVIIRKTQDPLG